jgi:hypothetical protein
MKLGCFGLGAAFGAIVALEAGAQARALLDAAYRVVAALLRLVGP